MSQHQLTRSDSLVARVIALSLLILLVVLVYFGVRWQLGDMVASLSVPGDPASADVAELAIQLAPADPAGMIVRGSLLGDSTVSDYQQAVRLAPHDYRWRIEYARALEQDGRTTEAEVEFKKAVDLAPTYSPPHWQLGNFYLRQKREAEAIAELKQAAANNRTYREQVFSLAWDLYDKDATQLDQFAGTAAEGRAALAYFLAGRGRGAEALALWKSLSPEERSDRAALASSIAKGLFIQRAFGPALEFSQMLGHDGEARPEAVTNGSFEKALDASEGDQFGWDVARGESRVDVASDNKVAHDGTRSARLTFKGYSKPTLANLLQTVAVVPGHRYKLSFWLRTENLRSVGMPMLEVLNAQTETTLGRTAAFISGTHDWQQFEIDFAVPTDSSGIVIRTVRTFCGEDCQINGILWYDDFQLAKP